MAKALAASLCVTRQLPAHFNWIQFYWWPAVLSPVWLICVHNMHDGIFNDWPFDGQHNWRLAATKFPYHAIFRLFFSLWCRIAWYCFLFPAMASKNLANKWIIEPPQEETEYDDEIYQLFTLRKRVFHFMILGQPNNNLAITNRGQIIMVVNNLPNEELRSVVRERWRGKWIQRNGIKREWAKRKKKMSEGESESAPKWGDQAAKLCKLPINRFGVQQTRAPRIAEHTKVLLSILKFNQTS